jgi:hypothetical protein
VKIDPQIPFNHDECLVSVFVIMPDEVSLQLHNLELVIVHLSDHFWLPLLVEQAKFLQEADRSVFHPTSVCQRTARDAAQRARSPSTCASQICEKALSRTSSIARTCCEPYRE